MGWLTRLWHSGDGQIRILAVMPDTPDRSGLEEIALRADWGLRFCLDCETAVAWLQSHTATVIILDRDQAEPGWREALRVPAFQATASRIIVSARETDDRFWLEVMALGGYDVVTRPFAERRLVSVVQRAIRPISSGSALPRNHPAESRSHTRLS